MNRLQMKRILSSLRPHKCPQCNGTGNNKSNLALECWACKGDGYIKPDADQAIQSLVMILLSLL